jgi:probable rRNA maturation factor
MKREIQIISRCNRLTLDESAIEDCLRELDTDPRFAVPEGDLSVVFLGDEEMGDLHGTFLGDATPTDVITFPGDPGFGEAGEICIGVEQAESVHGDHDVTLSHEILLYLAHGWLHLAGYDDKSKEDRLKMRRAEQEALDFLLADRKPPEFSLAG